jgi:hypothetical protein
VSIFSRTTVRAAARGGFDMANQQEQKPQESREAGTEREVENKPSTTPREAHEGSPGYGQPPEDVREKKLPDQKW